VQTDQVKKIIFLHQRYLTGQAGGRCANLQNADLAKLNLDGVDLRTVQASGVRFNDASLRLADLSKGDLFGAHFERADMRRANLLGADLRGILCRNKAGRRGHGKCRPPARRHLRRGRGHH